MLDQVSSPKWSVGSESESECKCLTCNQKPTGSQFSLLHDIPRLFLEMHLLTLWPWPLNPNTVTLLGYPKVIPYSYKWHGFRLKGQRSMLGLGLTAIRRGFELYECLLVELNAHLCCARFDYRFSCINRNFVRRFLFLWFKYALPTVLRPALLMTCYFIFIFI